MTEKTCFSLSLDFGSNGMKVYMRTCDTLTLFMAYLLATQKMSLIGNVCIFDRPNGGPSISATKLREFWFCCWQTCAWLCFYFQLRLIFPQKFKLLIIYFGEVKRSSCHRNANLDGIYTQFRLLLASFLNKVEVSECRTPSGTNLTGGDQVCLCRRSALIK